MIHFLIKKIKIKINIKWKLINIKYILISNVYYVPFSNKHAIFKILCSKKVMQLMQIKLSIIWFKGIYIAFTELGIKE